MSGHDGEKPDGVEVIPYDPESQLFEAVNGDAEERAFIALDYPSLEDAIAIPEAEDMTPKIGELLKDEAKELVAIVKDFGLPSENLERLARLFENPDSFAFISGPIAGQAEIGDAEAFVVDPETGMTDVYIAPQVVRNFVTDAMHVIEPVNGDQDIVFARDTGVRMAGMYALTVLCFEIFRQQTVHANPELISDLFETGHDEMPGLDTEMYADFLPHRMAARLAITRLARLTTIRYGFEDGIETAEMYAKHRQRAFDTVQMASYGRISFVDMATAYPLSEEATQRFLAKLPAVTARNLYSVSDAE